MPTWDEAKRRKNLREHGLDFEGCEQLFDGPVVVFEDQRDRYGELRLNAIGWLHGQVVHLTYKGTRRRLPRYQPAKGRET
jgi:uncharacterized protein